MVTCSLDTLKKSSKKKETRMKKEIVEMLQQPSYGNRQKQVLQQTSEAAVQKCFVKQVFLEISQNSQENTCARVSFLIKFSTLFKKRLWHRCFPVKFAKFLRTPFFIEHHWWLLLYREKRRGN